MAVVKCTQPMFQNGGCVQALVKCTKTVSLRGRKVEIEMRWLSSGSGYQHEAVWLKYLPILVLFTFLNIW